MERLQTNLNAFNSSSYVGGAKEFLTSNSIIAKTAFMVLVLIGFAFLFRAGVEFIKWYFSSPDNPILIKGIKNGKRQLVVHQSAKQLDKIVKRSRNRDGGIEFTWATWLYINEIEAPGTSGTKYKHIFHKGSGKVDDDGMAFPLNGPGLYIDSTGASATSVNNNLVVVMNTTSPSSTDAGNGAPDPRIKETATVKNVPLNKWVHVVIRVKGRAMDVYVNGTIALRHVFSGVPKQNYGNVYSGIGDGFDGMIADLRYFNSAVDVPQIMKMLKSGPDLTMAKSMFEFPPYLSALWYGNAN
jgi:hypothetical protein